MFEKFFGLSRDPFSIAPDPRYLFMSERHREALAHLLYGLDAGGGFVLLSGDIGTGKTTVCRCFLEQIPANCNVAYIFNPKLTVEELLTSVCDEFHVALPATAPTPATAKSLIDPLNAFLLNAHATGQNNVLIIDEAQNLSSDVLEQLRLLTNLETNERKLLQIILIGQPELRGMLARPELEQLAQRVIARFHLEALSQPETTDYIAHRLAVAGLTGPSPFDKKALARVYILSRGVPRRINLLCGRALLGAYAGGQRDINPSLVEKAANEVFGTQRAAASEPTAKPSTRTGSKLAPVLIASVIAVTLGVAVGVVLANTGVRSWPPKGWLALASKPAAASLAPVLATAPPTPAVAMTAPTVVITESAALATASAAASGALAATAPAPLPAPIPVPLTPDQFSAALASSPTKQNEALAALGKLWGVSLADINNISVCDAAAAQQIQCYSRNLTNLSLIRMLDRPGVVTLYVPEKQPVYALLTGLTPQSAMLKINNVSLSVPLAMLAQHWDGSFATLWRLPANLADLSAVTSNNMASNVWLGNQLGQLAGNTQTLAKPSTDQRGQLEVEVRNRIIAFQLAQGLPPDGKAGPMTLMQLNRAMGVSEPRLQNDKP